MPLEDAPLDDRYGGTPFNCASNPLHELRDSDHRDKPIFLKNGISTTPTATVLHTMSEFHASVYRSVDFQTVDGRPDMPTLWPRGAIGLDCESSFLRIHPVFLGPGIWPRPTVELTYTYM
jgi:hypothetical protein